MKIPKGSCVYAITVSWQEQQRMLRIGATSDLSKRALDYKILDVIPDAAISWWQVTDQFKTILEPYAKAYFESTNVVRPKHLRDRDIRYCLNRELGKSEYKAELAILDFYKRRHGRLPIGNARSGSKRAYVPPIDFVENGSNRLLELSTAEVPPKLTVSGAALISLLW
jgi:hypothetical protein